MAIGYSAGQRFLGGGQKYESEAVVQVQYALAANGGEVLRSGGALDNSRIIIVERMRGPSFLATVAAELPPEWGLDVDDLLLMVLVVPGAGNEPHASVKITATTKDPEMAQGIADTMADVIVRLVAEETGAEVDRILANTSKELDNISASLEKALIASQAVLSEALAVDSGVTQLIATGTGPEGDALVIGPGLEGNPQRLVELQALLIPYSVEQAKVSATERAYASQSGDLYSARVTKAKLLDPLIILQEASLPLPIGGLRLRDSLILGGGGGIMLAWVAANFVDNFTGWRRPKRPGQGVSAPPPADGSAAPSATAAPATSDSRSMEERLARAESRMERLPDLVATEVKQGVALILEKKLDKVSSAAADMAVRQVMRDVMREVDERLRRQQSDGGAKGEAKGRRQGGWWGG